MGPAAPESGQKGFHVSAKRLEHRNIGLSSDAHPADSVAVLWAKFGALERRVAALETEREPKPEPLISTETLLFDLCVRRGHWGVSGDGRIGEGTVAMLLGMTRDSVRNLRRYGDGPRAYRLGGGGHRV